jgi:hypothetical protein
MAVPRSAVLLAPNDLVDVGSASPTPVSSPCTPVVWHAAGCQSLGRVTNVQGIKKLRFDSPGRLEYLEANCLAIASANISAVLTPETGPGFGGGCHRPPPRDSSVVALPTHCNMGVASTCLH